MGSAICGGLAGAMVLSIAATAAAQTITIDHRTNTARVEGGDVVNRVVREGGEIRVRKPDGIGIKAVYSNSALYDCSVSDTAISVPELDSLKTFLRILGPYFTDVLATRTADAGAALEKGKDPATTTHADLEAAKPVQDLLGKLDSFLGELHSVRMRSLSRLDSLNRLNSAFTAANAGAGLLTPSLCGPDPDDHCPKFLLTPSLLATLGSLHSATRELQKYAARTSPPSAIIQETLYAADTALNSEDAIVQLTYVTEKLFRQTITASSDIDCKTLDIAWDKGRSYTVTIKAKEDAILAHLPKRAPFTLNGTVQPEWFIRPQLGVALIHARGARFPRFGTTQASDDSVKIIRQGTQNYTIDYALVLGLTTRAFEIRRRPGLILWLPEFIVNPTSELKSLGVGTGVGYRFLRLSTGYVFVKHDVLDGQSVGQMLPSAGELTTRKTYRGGKLYFSVAVTGLPPFVRE
ncbi:MAG: hypothetical protein H0T48_11995 [Gemmatimonadaceae bacterium]|nr:hypothetical protein [Gemmatimonadaceae bacterium]